MPDHIKPKRAPVRTTKAIAGAPDADPEITDDAFFVKLQKDFEKLVVDPDVLISIPCWGWVGDGKTCSLLTAVHFCDVGQHGVSLARVKDSDELRRLEERYERYRGLGLAGIAEATISRLGELNQVFFEDNSWPPGTDIANFYLLEVRAQKGRVAFVLLPDLRGGSFQQPDEASRTVTTSAHAFIVMVNPDRFVENSPIGKEYKEDVIGRLQRCASEKIPTCVMLSRADKFAESPEAADTTHKELAALLDKLEFPNKIFRVSVLGESAPPDAQTPPRLIDRKPDQLVRAWVWTMHQALTSPRDAVLQKVPATDLAGGRTRASNATPVHELRLVRDDQTGPGRVLCAVPTGGNSAFIFLDSEGVLSEVILGVDGVPLTKTQSTLPDDIDQGSAAAILRDGCLFLGDAASEANVWFGVLGSTFRKTELPYPLPCWTPLSDRLLCGLDASGTLHLLRLSANKWESSDYLSNFLKATPAAVVELLPVQNAILACNGETCVAVRVEPRGKFGPRLAMSVGVQYAEAPSMINNAGFVVGRGASNEVIFGREKAHRVGTLNPAAPLIALAVDEPVVAWVSAENQLLAAAMLDAKPVQTDPGTATKLPEAASEMCWDAKGRLLAVSYPSSRCAWFRRLGL